MGKHKTFEPTGVIPACLLPFHPDLSIDERSLRKHLDDVASVAGISAITINAHSTEVASCTFEEQERVLTVTMNCVGDRVPVVHGVYADGGQEAARIARMADQGGASALLVFPPNPFIFGGHSRPEMAIDHFRRIAEASDLPIIAFQYPLSGGLGYPIDVLIKLIDEVPTIRAIKDWCNNPKQHEAHIRLLQSRSRPVNVLSTHSAWLFGSLVLGCNGLLSGSGSVLPDLQVALWQAVKASDLKRARAINDRIYPTANAFYADPVVDMHNRMKEALVMLGRIPCAAVRPPLLKLDPAEIDRIRIAIGKAGIRHEGAFGQAAQEVLRTL